MKFIKLLALAFTLIISNISSFADDPIIPITKQFKVADDYGMTWELVVIAVDGQFPSTSMIIDGYCEQFGFFPGPQFNNIDLVKAQIAWKSASHHTQGLISNSRGTYAPMQVSVLSGTSSIQIISTPETPTPFYGIVNFHIIYQ